MASMNLFDLLDYSETDNPEDLFDLHAKKLADIEKTKEEERKKVAEADAKRKEEAEQYAYTQANKKYEDDLKDYKEKLAAYEKDNTLPVPVRPVAPSVKAAKNGDRVVPGRDHGSRGYYFPARDSRSNGNVNGFSGGNRRHSGVEEQNNTRKSKAAVDTRTRQSHPSGRSNGYGNGEASRESVHAPHKQSDQNLCGRENSRDGVEVDAKSSVSTELTQQQVEVTKNEEKASNLEKEDVSPVSDANKDIDDGVEGKEVEKKALPEKVMTLAEYQKTLEEKRKSLIAGKAKERKVDYDKEFESMQQLSVKKENNEIFIKLGSGKDAGKRKEDNEKAKKDEKTKKANAELLSFLHEPPRRGGFGGRGPQRGGFDGRGRGDHTQLRESIDGSIDRGQSRGSIEGHGDGANTKGGGSWARGGHSAQPRGGSDGRVGYALPGRGRGPGDRGLPRGGVTSTTSAPAPSAQLQTAERQLNKEEFPPLTESTKKK